MIRFDRMTIKAQEALAEAQKLAEKAGHQQLDVEHLALALVLQREGLTQSLLNKLGADPDVLARALEQELKKIPQVSGSGATGVADRKSTRLNSSHGYISYAVFCLKKKTTISTSTTTV